MKQFGRKLLPDKEAAKVEWSCGSGGMVLFSAIIVKDSQRDQSTAALCPNSIEGHKGNSLTVRGITTRRRLTDQTLGSRGLMHRKQVRSMEAYQGVSKCVEVLSQV